MRKFVKKVINGVSTFIYNPRCSNRIFISKLIITGCLMMIVALLTSIKINPSTVNKNSAIIEPYLMEYNFTVISVPERIAGTNMVKFNASFNINKDDSIPVVATIFDHIKIGQKIEVLNLTYPARGAGPGHSVFYTLKIPVTPTNP